MPKVMKYPGHSSDFAQFCSNSMQQLVPSLLVRINLIDMFPCSSPYYIYVATKGDISLAHFTHGNDFAQEPIKSHNQTITAESWVAGASAATSLYVHVPFCFHKCHYCDFFSIVGNESKHELFVERVAKELEYLKPFLGEMETVFIGGGTPTLLSDSLLQKLVFSIKTNITFSKDYEWTIEANPETVNIAKAELLVRAGVNRVSIGAQSFNLKMLKNLERWHDPKSVGISVEAFRSVGIKNINLDLIYSIPGQTISILNDDLNCLLDLSPEHLSCYTLTYEQNTPLLHRLHVGDVTRIEHELEAEMLDVVQNTLSSSGYSQYEISNFAKDGYECRHNLSYWNNKNWWPVGPSASGHLCGKRWKNTSRLSDYLHTSALPPIIDIEELGIDAQVGESFMLGLRLVKGMPISLVEQLLNKPETRWRKKVIENHLLNGYLVQESSFLRLSSAGIRFADSVISDLLMQEESTTDTFIDE